MAPLVPLSLLLSGMSGAGGVQMGVMEVNNELGANDDNNDHDDDDSGDKFIDFKLCKSDIYSNLGCQGGVNIENDVIVGQPGPNDPCELRYKKVYELPDGTVCDLRLTNTTVYTPNPDNPKQAAQEGYKEIGGEYLNGKKGCFGRINIYSPGDVKLKLEFVQSGTTTACPPGNTYDFTVMDFDRSPQGMAEEVHVYDPETFSSTDMQPKFGPDGQAIFRSKEANVNVPNPEDPFDLSEDQLGATVGVGFSRTSWEIKLIAEDASGLGAVGGRNFLFAGRTTMQVEVPPKEATTTPCPDGTNLDDTGTCVVYQDPHIDGFDNPNHGPFLTRVGIFDSNPKVSLLGMTRDSNSVRKMADTGAWHTGREPSIDVNVYDKGDFWLVKNDLVQIQGRYNVSAEFGGSRSGLSALAIGGPIIGDGKLMVEPKNGAVTFFGERVRPVQEYVKETSAGRVQARTYYNAFTEGGVAPSGVDLSLPQNVFLQIRRYNTHLDAKITMPHSAGNTDGQCGNFNGNPHDDSLDEIAHRMSTVGIAPEDLLFEKPFDAE